MKHTSPESFEFSGLFLFKNIRYYHQGNQAINNVAIGKRAYFVIVASQTPGFNKIPIVR